MIVLAAFSTASAYVIGFCVSIVLLLLAVLIATCIKFRPDLSDVTARKVWFWIIAVLNPVFSFGLAYFIVYVDIKVHNQQDAYMTAMCFAAVISFVLYVVLGIIAAKINKHGKVGNWF